MACIQSFVVVSDTAKDEVLAMVFKKKGRKVNVHITISGDLWRMMQQLYLLEQQLSQKKTIYDTEQKRLEKAVAAAAAAAAAAARPEGSRVPQVLPPPPPLWGMGKEFEQV